MLDHHASKVAAVIISCYILVSQVWFLSAALAAPPAG